MKGKINVYQCPKGHKTVTVDREDGVTPFMMRCQHPECNEWSRSSFYRVEQTLLPEYEFYKPDSLQALDQGEKIHVQKGGLLLRKIVIGKPA